ncbi:hypothetical protein BX600DRAFT_517055 [Xylariales sp. PMI_506]|nr:hypothetical protein BX600DRAFT_517055 [Xylariales sp. PMI_506]
MSAPRLRVLISGAGIAGTCLAYWLTKMSIHVSITIVERSPVPRATGQSIDIHGPAVEIVKMMKLEEAIRARHTTEEAAEMKSSSGKTTVRFEAGDTFTCNYEILRADLVGLFMEAIDELENVKYIFGDWITSLEQHEKHVDVVFQSGLKDTFDLVVAADGSSSKTRPLILDSEVLKNSYTFLGQYIAFFSIPSQPSDPKVWQCYNIPKGRCLMLRPHRNPATTGTYMCITMPARGKREQPIEDAMNEGVEAEKKILHNYFENAGWQAQRILEGMDQASDFYMARAAQVRLPKWTTGRALVLGDAAWSTFGVGTTLAIEGAYLLAGELSKIQSSDEIPEALVRYEQVFRPFYAKMEDLPSWFPQLVFPQSAWGIWLRNAILWVASKTKVHKLFQDDSENNWTLPPYEWVGI